MELVKLEDDLKIIQNLSTFPNADDGLTPEELKEKFDLAGQKIQQYLNEQVVPAVRDLQGSKSPFCVTVNSDQNGGFAMDKTMDELHKAYNAGQLMYCNHGTLLPLATVFSDSTNSQGYMFQGMQYGTTFVRVRIDSNGIVVETSALAKTGDALRNPQKLILTGAVAAEYDGSAEVTVEIPAVDFRVDVFSSSDGYVADETINDIQAADYAGRTVYCALETDEQQWIYLPMVKVQDSVYYFAAVCEGVEWLVTIARGDEDNTVVNVTQHEAGGSGGSAEIHIGSDEPTGDEVVWIDRDAEADSGFIQAPATAEVGQTIVVKAVDETGKPTEWECVDCPEVGSGDGATETLVASYTHSGNLEVVVSSIDYDTGIITAVGHGLSENDIIYATQNWDVANLENPEVWLPTGMLYGSQYYAVNVTTDTFQISTAKSGTAATLSTKETADFSKWHFERDTDQYGSSIKLTNVGTLTSFAVRIFGKSLNNGPFSPNIPAFGNGYFSTAVDGFDTFHSFIGVGRQSGNILLNVKSKIQYDKTVGRYVLDREGLRVNNKKDSTYKVEITGLDGHGVSEKMSPITITNMTFWNCGPANGTIVEVYKL